MSDSVITQCYGKICARKTIMLEAFTVEPKNDCIIVIIPYILHKTN